MMKALVSSQTGHPLSCTLQVVSRSLPKVSTGSVLVRICANGINPSDAANGLKNLFNVPKPNIPGRDFSGVVEESESSSFPPGTAVFGTSGNALSFTVDGTSAEYAAIPEALLAKKPATLSFVRAGTIGTPYCTALLALDAARCLPSQSERVLVLGSRGAVGQAATNIAKAYGCTVVGTSRSKGLAEVDTSKDPELKTVKEQFGNKSPDVVIDTVGSVELMEAAMSILAPRGRYIVLASFKGGATQYPLDILNFYRQAQTLSSVNSIAQSPEETGTLMRRVAGMLEHGSIQLPADEADLQQVSVEQGVMAYEQAMLFSAKKYVIIFQ